MAAQGVLWALALCLTTAVRFTAAQCPTASFTTEASTACCDNAMNTGGLFGTPKCCRTSDGLGCFCDPNANLVGEGCVLTGGPATTTTMAPAMTTTPVPVTAAETTPVPTTEVPTTAVPTTTEQMTTTMPTTTTTTAMPTTTPEPLCPVPGPVGRILNAMPITSCEENGAIAFSVVNPSDPSAPEALICHGVFAYNSTSMMREMWMSDYCWTQVRSYYRGGLTVHGTLQGESFDVNDCFIGEVTVDNVGIARVELPSIMQWFLDSIGTANGCRSTACVPDDSIRSSVDLNNCYIISYGTTTEQPVPIPLDSTAKKITVLPEPRQSQCGPINTDNSYQENDSDKFCFLAQDGGANCRYGDAGAPVYCLTDTTMEPVLTGFTIPNLACDPANNKFLVDLV